MGVYHISEILYLIGAPEVERISGKVYQETPIDERRRAESGYNVEELGLGFVRFEGGLTLDIIEAWAMHLDRMDGSVILGSHGGIRLRPFSFHTTSWDMELDAHDQSRTRWSSDEASSTTTPTPTVVPAPLDRGAAGQGGAAPDGRDRTQDDADPRGHLPL